MPRDNSSLQPTSDGYLHIPHPTSDDTGIYVCTATSPVGYASREIQLSVNSKNATLELHKHSSDSFNKRSMTFESLITEKSRLNTEATCYYSFVNSSPAMPKIMGVSGHDNTVKMVAEVGTDVVLPCDAQGTPSPLVTWSRNGRPFPSFSAG